jgi:hypothetical protein
VVAELLRLLLLRVFLQVTRLQPLQLMA